MRGPMAAEICQKSVAVACQAEWQRLYVKTTPQLHAKENGSVNMWKKCHSCMPGQMEALICEKSATAA
jgi:hypothetical protein